MDYFDSSLITNQIAAAVPNTPPRRVPRGNSWPLLRSHLRPNQTATPMEPAMVNAMPENRRNAPEFGVRFGVCGAKYCGVIPRLAAGRLP